MHLSLPKHTGQRPISKQRCEGGIQDIKAAGECAKGGQDHAPAVRDKAAASYTCAPRPHPGAGVKMACHLSQPISARGLVNEPEAAEGERCKTIARQALWAIAIMISSDPNHLAIRG